MRARCRTSSPKLGEFPPAPLFGSTLGNRISDLDLCSLSHSASFTASTSPVRASSANLNPYAPASAARAPPTIKTVNLSSDTGDDEDDSTLDPDMLRIRNARRRQGGSALLSDDLQIISGGATTPPVKEARDEEEEQTTIRVSMVMDPDRTTSAAARRGYEAPIPVQMGMVSVAVFFAPPRLSLSSQAVRS